MTEPPAEVPLCSMHNKPRGRISDAPSSTPGLGPPSGMGALNAIAKLL